MFKVGDEVIVIGEDYGITTKGSVGVVMEVNTYTNLAVVFFTTLTSGRYGHHDYGKPNDHYFININDLGLTNPVNPHLAVIAKIKEMEARRIKLKKAKVRKTDDVVAPYF
jgi:hypothetical protein